MDIISQLEGVTHVLEEIFLDVDIETLCETVQVSTTWKRLITSLNVFVWKKNLKMSPTWRTLAVRMEHLQPQLWDRMNKGDATSYREACRYVEGNIRQISQSATKHLNFKAVPKVDRRSFIRMNDKYVFIDNPGKIVILNRWTQQLVKDFVFRGDVVDMKLNERFLVVRLREVGVEEIIVVYDVQKLERIQTLGRKEFYYNMKFCLGSDVIFISERRLQSNNYKFEVHRWNASAARFVRDTETEERSYRRL